MPISIMFKPQWINIWVSGWDFSLPNFSTPKSWVSSFWTTFFGETIPPSIASLLVRGFGGFELWDLQIPKKWYFPIRINWTLLGDVKNLERVTKNMIDIMMHWISLKSFNQSTPTKRQTNPWTIDPGNKTTVYDRWKHCGPDVQYLFFQVHIVWQSCVAVAQWSTDGLFFKVSPYEWSDILGWKNMVTHSDMQLICRRVFF